jgi:hypothetical protein
MTGVYSAEPVTDLVILPVVSAFTSTAGARKATARLLDMDRAYSTGPGA